MHTCAGAHRGQKVLSDLLEVVNGGEPLAVGAGNRTQVLGRTTVLPFQTLVSPLCACVHCEYTCVYVCMYAFMCTCVNSRLISA